MFLSLLFLEVLLELVNLFLLVILSLEHFGNVIFLFFLAPVESPAELQQGHGTIVVTDGTEFARSMEVRAVGVHADALESTVRDLVLKSELILTVEVVPDLDPTCHKCLKRTYVFKPADTACQVLGSTRSLRDWCTVTELLHLKQF